MPDRITLGRLTDDLRRLGLAAGDTVMLHASIRAVGPLVGGPDIVHRAVADVVGAAGTLMMLVGWEDDLFHIERLPAADQQAYLEELPAFDPATGRAARSFGVLAEFFRTWPGVRRSRSTTGGFAALGLKAEWLFAGQTLSDYYGFGSPLDRLCQAGGKVLLLGSDLSNVTLLHFAEYLAQVPDKRTERHPEVVLVDGRRAIVEVTALDCSDGIVAWPGGDYFGLITRDYLRACGIAPGKVGDADSYLLDAADLADYGARWMERSFASRAFLVRQ